MLKVSEVSKTFRRPTGRVEALSRISLEVAPGELVAVRGPSGSGKTTLLLVAGGLLRPDTGEVVCDGRNVYDLHADARARFRAGRVGFVFQQYHLVPYLSVAENIMLPTLAAGIEKAGSEVLRLIERLGIAHRAGHLPGELSVGEKQRTAFCRALLSEPKLLLVDEPTGNLDKPNAEVLLRCLSEFAESGGAVLMATHDDQAAGRAQRQISLETSRA
jgi:putative ABC transport system ATP-binding protein